MNRPAEKAGAGGSLALLVSYVAGVKDPEALVAIGVVLGLVPGAVTLLVASGGVRGVARRLWSGQGGVTLVELLVVLLVILVILFAAGEIR